MNSLSQELLCRELAFQWQGSGFRLLLKRNCSISPSGLLWAYGLIAFVTLGIAAVFAVLGAWMILPFAGIEIVCLGIAFIVNGRHATDYEQILLDDGRLTVEVRESDSIRRHEFNSAWARVRLTGEGSETRVVLESSGHRLEVGRHLRQEARLDLAGELNRRLRN